MKLKQVKKIYSDGRHNAFTNMEYWQGYYYVSFRNAARHAVPGDYGDVLIIRSNDLESWDICARISADANHDDRDPALLNIGNRLAVFFGTDSTDKKNRKKNPK